VLSAGKSRSGKKVVLGCGRRIIYLCGVGRMHDDTEVFLSGDLGDGEANVVFLEGFVGCLIVFVFFRSNPCVTRCMLDKANESSSVTSWSFAGKAASSNGTASCR